MSPKKQENPEQLSVVDAVETLSSLADLEFEAPIGVTQGKRLVIGGEGANYRTVHWLHEGNRKQTVDAVRETFRVVLDYLSDFFEGQTLSPTSKEVEGIRTIMVLIGEAAEKLDRFTMLFRRHDLPSVTELPEYLDLQKFYREKFLTQVEGDPRFKDLFEGAVQSKKAKRRTYVGKKQIKDGRRVFVDLDSVKRDTEYDLLFLRKIGGQRFYSPDLVRNLRLICDFGRVFGTREDQDPLLRTRYWLDKMLHVTARDLIARVGGRIDEFYRSASNMTDKEVVSLLNKALMALFLSANPRHLIRNSPVKTCSGYFADFQVYLRQTLNSLEYRKMVASGSGLGIHHWQTAVVDTIHGLCYGLFAQARGHLSLQPVLDLLLTEEEEESGLTAGLHSRWKRLSEVVKRHPSGPLFKVLEGLTQGQMRHFDNYVQLNLPGRLFELEYGKQRVIVTRLPVPIWQEYVQEAHIIPEYKAFLRGGIDKRRPRRHLVVDLQDATSWKEHARTKGLAEVNAHEEYEEGMSLIALNKDSEFYYQTGPYAEIGEAKAFKDTFKEQLRDEGTGFRFPVKIRTQALGEFSDQVMDAIHEFFFEGRNALSRKERCDFIELYYHFLILKVFEVVKPDSCSFTCKDGIDSGASSTAAFFALTALLSGEEWDAIKASFLANLMFGPAMMLRERMIHPQRFEQSLGFLKRVEEKVEDMGKAAFQRQFKVQFGKLYSHLPSKCQLEALESPEEPV